MMAIPVDCKRLAEVAFPLVEVALNGAEEKQISTGHISAIHVWWARRPLATSRAMNLSLLLPDPEDPNCPDSIRSEMERILLDFENRTQPFREERIESLKSKLLWFIGSYSSWKKKGVGDYNKCARELIYCCHEKPPVTLDPFAGGGSIPLESHRIGAHSIASDLNPIPLILNNLQMKILPQKGGDFFKQVELEANKIQQTLISELSDYYPTPSSEKETPVGYICARTVKCEGVSCGVTYPLLSSTYVTKKKENIHISFSKDSKNQLTFSLKKGTTSVINTVKRGNSTCPICSFLMKKNRVQQQLASRRGGTEDSIMLAVVFSKQGARNKKFRLPTTDEIIARGRAKQRVKELESQISSTGLGLLPDEDCIANSRYLTVPNYGMNKWADLYTSRQLLTQMIACREISQIEDEGVKTVLALVASKWADRNCSLAGWVASGNRFGRCFGLQTIQMTWDFIEINPTSNHGPSWLIRVNSAILGIKAAMEGISQSESQVFFADATNHPLPDDSVDALFTDPPYYDKVPYSNLSNFFIIWLKRMIDLECLDSGFAPRVNEVIMDLKDIDAKGDVKDSKWYENSMKSAFIEQRRIIKDSGVGYVVYADKTTEGWATMLTALVDANWDILGSWPIATELNRRLRAQRSAALNTSVHIIIRPRKKNSGVGKWNEIITKLPGVISEWMAKMEENQILGADAIFSSIGPAMNLFSKYDSVERADGTVISIRDYLKVLWDTIASEALKSIEKGESQGSFEDDARMTMLVLWTLRNSGLVGNDGNEDNEASNSELTYDTAITLARGIGVDINNLEKKRILEVTKKNKGAYMVLFSPHSRREYLLGKSETITTINQESSKSFQMKLGEDLEEAQVRNHSEGKNQGPLEMPKRDSQLDKLHQAMLLHADGNSVALEAHLRNNIGDDQAVWQLANTLNRLYPEGSWERRKIEGVIARHQSLR